MAGEAGRVERSEAEWRSRLSRHEYAVLRRGRTERAGTSRYLDRSEPGVYRCRGCDAVLFRSTQKFDSGTGWPSFWSPADVASVVTHDTSSFWIERVEVRCATCDSHLGHVFRGEGYPTPTDARYCINGVALHLDQEHQEHRDPG